MRKYTTHDYTVCTSLQLKNAYTNQISPSYPATSDRYSRSSVRTYNLLWFIYRNAISVYIYIRIICMYRYWHFSEPFETCLK